MKDNLRHTILYSLALINMALVSLFGVLTPLVYVTLGFMFFDLISRVYAASMRDDEKVESKKVFKGLGNKFGIIMLIMLSLLIDYGLSIIVGLVLSLLDMPAPKIVAVMPFTLAWIFVREATSICENLIHAGIKVPTFITKALTITSTAIDKVNSLMEDTRPVPLVYPKEEGEQQDANN